MSAVFTGRIYYRMGEHDGYWQMTKTLWKRTVRLYGYHALLLLFMFLVAVPIAARGNRPGLHNLLDFYFIVGAKQSITEAYLLVYRPPLLDILPMYIIFLMFTSVALLLSRKIGWKPILWTAFAVWLVAQFGFRAAEHNFMMRFIPTRIPLNEMGSFDLWAWQFLWIMGIWLGVRWGQNNLEIEDWAKRAVIPAAIVGVVLLVTRHAITFGLELGQSAFLFDKWHLGAVRLLDFVALATLLLYAQRILKPLAVRPLVTLGQSSLQVFCVHLLFCFAGLTVLGNATMLSGWQQFGLLAATFSAMMLTAKIFSKSEEKQERQPKMGEPTAKEPSTTAFTGVGESKPLAAVAVIGHGD